MIWLILISILCFALAGAWRVTIALRKADGLTLETVHRMLPELAPALVVMVVGIYGFVRIQSDFRLMWYLPSVLDRYTMPFLWIASGGFMTYLASCACKVAYAKGHPERHKLTVSAILIVTAFAVIYIRVSLPIYRHLYELETADGVVLQTSGASCAAASAANIVRLYGLPATEREMAQLAGTTVLGTSPGEIIAALGRKNIRAVKRTLSLNDLMHLAHPAILSVASPWQGPDSHAIVLPPATMGRRRILDPLNGTRALDLKELALEWNGHLIECQLITSTNELSKRERE
jgi:predicted double-glycine peptidase